MHLCIDVQKDTCDPAFNQKLVDGGIKCDPDYTNHFPVLDSTAQKIADFTEATRSSLKPIWVYSRYLEMENHPELGPYYKNQGVPHHVSRLENDPVLEKRQMSAVPENMEFFKDLKSKGVKGFVVTGLYANDCVLQTVKDLQKLGFDIIVAEDLVESALPSKRAEGIGQIKESGAAVVAQKTILENIHSGRVMQKPEPENTGIGVTAKSKPMVKSAGDFLNALQVAKRISGDNAGFDISRFMTLGREERTKEIQALQDILTGGDGSPLPETISIHGKPMLMGDALTGNFREVRAAMTDPLALEAMASWKTLGDYKQKWQGTRPDTAIKVENPEPERFEIEAAPALS
jgi:nicotinamidase-related amidase